MTVSTLPRRYIHYVRQTLKDRIPAIVQKAGRATRGDASEALRALAGSVLGDQPMQMELRDWPFPGWEALPAQVDGVRPSEAAFFAFEHWLYFRILTIVDFPGTRLDPFRNTKHADLARHVNWAAQAIQRTRTLADGLRLSLDGNAHDLSQVSGPSARHEIGRELLHDVGQVRRLNLIADNFGAEFVADLVLAIIAAEDGIEAVVHVKTLPMFVSDTTMDDVSILLERGGVDAFSRRLAEAVASGRLRFAAHPFWSAPLFLDALPREEMGSGEGVLNVLKGDLNFRRAIGDAVVPVDTPFHALAVLPAAPMLSLRSIKSYCASAMIDWPADVSREIFPTDGSIVVTQKIPARVTASA